MSGSWALCFAISRPATAPCGWVRCAVKDRAALTTKEGYHQSHFALTRGSYGILTSVSSSPLSPVTQAGMEVQQLTWRWGKQKRSCYTEGPPRRQDQAVVGGRKASHEAGDPCSGIFTAKWDSKPLNLRLGLFATWMSPLQIGPVMLPAWISIFKTPNSPSPARNQISKPHGCSGAWPAGERESGAGLHQKMPHGGDQYPWSCLPTAGSTSWQRHRVHVSRKRQS